MATLEKIRKRGVLLIIVIGVALLSFIIGDFLTQGSTYFNKSREVVAEINGKKIKIQEYQDFLDQITIFQKYESGVREIDEQTMQQLRSFAWEQFINEYILTAEAEKVGLVVGKEELSDRLIGNNIHPIIQQRNFFVDENGQFSRTQLIQFLNFKDQEPTDYQMQEQLSDLKKLWIFLERTVKVSILQEKYNALLSNAVYTNKLDAETNFNWNNKIIDLEYIVKPYYEVSDADFIVTDKEIKTRYNKQLNQYRQEPNASIKFISLPIEPKEDDYAEAEAFINNLVDEFNSSDDVIELVNMNSDTPYSKYAYSETTVPSHYKDFAFSGKKGDTMGPDFVNEAYTMAKIMETGIMQSDSVKLRHIFLIPEDESKADSIIGAIRNRADFASLADKYSAVRATAENGGEIGWLTENTPGLDRKIIDDAFSKRVNDVFTFKNMQGTQIIQIMEKTAPKKKVRLAILEREVIASSRTQASIFNEAKRFAAGLKAADFDSTALKNDYNLRHANNIYQSNENVQNIPQSRQIVRWAFENSKGTVSDVFECGQELIVAVLTSVNTDKYQPLDQVEAMIRSEIVRDKKAEQFTQEYKEALSENPSLDALASNLGLELKTAESLRFGSSQLGSEGSEPAVIGSALALEIGQVSAPIKGNAGVYVFQNTNIENDSNELDLDSEKQNLSMQYKYSIVGSVMQNLREKTDIKDYRLKFY